MASASGKERGLAAGGRRSCLLPAFLQHAQTAGLHRRLGALKGLEGGEEGRGGEGEDVSGVRERERREHTEAYKNQQTKGLKGLVQTNIHYWQ